MPQTYKGTQIPAYGDTADGPAAFIDMVDGGGTVGICTSGTRPANPVYGHTIFNTSVGYHEFWNGSAWTRLDIPNAPHLKMHAINWVASGEAIPAITDSRQFLVQAGRTVATCDAASYFYINFPTAFPNGCINVMATGRHDGGGVHIINTSVNRTFNRSSAGMAAMKIIGNPGTYGIDNCIGDQVTVDWVAVGW